MADLGEQEGKPMIVTEPIKAPQISDPIPHQTPAPIPEKREPVPVRRGGG